jgi:hypothetical protein
MVFNDAPYIHSQGWAITWPDVAASLTGRLDHPRLRLFGRNLAEFMHLVQVLGLGIEILGLPCVDEYNLWERIRCSVVHHDVSTFLQPVFLNLGPCF